MSVKVICLASLKSAKALESFDSLVSPTMAPYGGKFVDAGIVGEVYSNELGCPSIDGAYILDFPSSSEADAWANSEAYKGLLELRKEALDVTLFKIVGSS